VCAGDLNILDKKFVNPHDWLFTYKYESVLNYSAQQWMIEGKASLILNLDT